MLRNDFSSLSLGNHADIGNTKRFGNGRYSIPQNESTVQFAFRYDQAAFTSYVDVVDTADKALEFCVSQFFAQHFQARHQLGFFFGEPFFNRRKRNGNYTGIPGNNKILLIFARH